MCANEDGRKETGPMILIKYVQWNGTPEMGTPSLIMNFFAIADVADTANDRREGWSGGCTGLCQQTPHVDDTGIQRTWRHR